MICFFNLFAENDFYRSLGAHYGYFCRRPGNIIICTDMLGVHHIVRPSIRFAGNDRHFGDGGFAEGVQEFRSVLDDSPPDRKSTRLNSSHVANSYAVFCLKKKRKTNNTEISCSEVTTHQKRNYTIAD